MMERQSCPICGGIKINPLKLQTDYPLKRCSDCSLVFLDYPNSVELFENIETEYFGNGYLNRRDLFSEQFLIHKAKARLNIIRRFKSAGSIVDIGCGTGELVYMAQQYGYQAEGIEYSKLLADYVRKKYDVVIYCGELSKIMPHNKYDIAVMSHVLEHTIDPVKTLQDIKKFLNPGGILYIAVPNLDCLEAKFKGWGSYEPYHLWYFNASSLRKLLKETGYDLLDIHTWEPYSAWLNTFIRTMIPTGYSDIRTAIHNDHNHRLRNRILISMGLLNVVRFISGIVFTPMRKIQEFMHRGEELIIVSENRQ